MCVFRQLIAMFIMRPVILNGRGTIPQSAQETSWSDMQHRSCRINRNSSIILFCKALIVFQVTMGRTLSVVAAAIVCTFLCSMMYTEAKVRDKIHPIMQYNPYYYKRCANSQAGIGLTSRMREV
jgi:hypothetical protein